MIKACTFDLDGVIVDTAKFHFQAWQDLARSLGIEFTEKHNENLKGVGRMDSLRYILSLGSKELSQKEMEDLAAAKNDQYTQLIASLDRKDILPGVLDFLKLLRSADIRIALGSSSKNARKVLDYLDLYDYFDVIVDGTNISRSKPDPQVFELGAEALELIPNEIVVFEDAQAGIDAAIQGGFRCIGIGSDDELKNADYIMEGFIGFDLDELKNVLN